MGPRRKSLNFLTLKKTSKRKENENDFLHCVSDYRARVTKRKSTGTMKTARVSASLFPSCTDIFCSWILKLRAQRETRNR